MCFTRRVCIEKRLGNRIPIIPIVAGFRLLSEPGKNKTVNRFPGNNNVIVTAITSLLSMHRELHCCRTARDRKTL